MTSNPEAVLLAAKAPSPEQQAKLEEFISHRYGPGIRLVFHEDPSMHGFLLEVGSDIYDFSVRGRFEQLRHAIDAVSAKDGDIIPLLRETIRRWTPQALAEEIGTVVTVGDGIATVQGMKNASYGEILLFSSGIRGMVQNLNEHEISCILFDDDEGVTEGSAVKRTGKVAGIPVGEAMIGRVIGALGNPIDGKGEIETKAYRRIESPAPGIIDRSPVTRPLETGILAIDSMFPIGRGQRELIIGDRQTGKTAIALDTILNQKGKGVICVICCHRSKSKLHRTAYRKPGKARRDGIYHRCRRHRLRARPAAIHCALCRLRHRRIFHEQGTGCSDRLRRSFQACRRLPFHEPSARQIAGTRGVSGRRFLSALPSFGALRPAFRKQGRRQHRRRSPSWKRRRETFRHTFRPISFPLQTARSSWKAIFSLPDSVRPSTSASPYPASAAALRPRQ